eukprot:gene7842-9656_t
MCKHILNAQVSIRATCCKKWFDCAECHREVSDHEIRKTEEMVFACKKCKKVFRKNLTDFEETDEYCPHCDAKTPENKFMLSLEGDSKMFLDHREKRRVNSLFDGQIPEEYKYNNVDVDEDY